MADPKRPPGKKPDGLASHGGEKGIRTLGLCLAKAALSQLSYIPMSGALVIVAGGFPTVK